MQSALRITTKVLPGNKIEIEIPEAEIGDSVDVFVILPEKVEAKKRSVMEILEEVHAKRPPKSAEEIDKQLREERESWDS
jgi:antitoxin component of MazEF toxin-antitoxin module